MRTLLLIVAATIVLSVSAFALPIPGSDYELQNWQFNSLDGWIYTPGDVVLDPGAHGNPAPAVKCNHETGVGIWGDRMRQVVDDSLNRLWDWDLHQKMIDLTADISLDAKGDEVGGIRFRLDYWDERYNDLCEPPSVNDPGYYTTDWVEYLTTDGYGLAWQTVNPFNQIVLDIQPRWVSVEIEFLQPIDTINRVDNVILTSKCIPEATTLMLGFMGLSTVAGFRKLRRK